MNNAQIAELVVAFSQALKTGTVPQQTQANGELAHALQKKGIKFVELPDGSIWDVWSSSHQTNTPYSFTLYKRRNPYAKHYAKRNAKRFVV